MTERIPGTKAVAEMLVQAEIDFLKVLEEMGGISREQVVHVMAVFRKAKAVKRISLNRYAVVHGAYLDRDVIRRAVNYQL